MARRFASVIDPRAHVAAVAKVRIEAIGFQPRGIWSKQSVLSGLAPAGARIGGSDGQR
jgi:hypothetical protein